MQEEKVYYIASEHIACTSYMKFVMMEFILTTDKKVNIVILGKTVHDLLHDEGHNFSNTTLQQHNDHEQYQFGNRGNA